MGTIKTLFVGASTGLLLLTFSPTTTSFAGSGDNACYKFSKAERRFARMANRARTNNDLTKLRLDPELSKAAKVHTREMVRKDTLYHTPTSKLYKRVTKWNSLGENVGVGSAVKSLHKAFMNSPAHRDNILHSPFEHHGVGVIKKGDRMWVTVMFESVRNPGTTLRMPNC